MPVEHYGNQIESPEEVEQISSLIDHLLSNGATWTNQEGVTRPLNLKEILVVAPYNAQVAALRENCLLTPGSPR
jgi:superfamily I DNA and/or RNA helicase